MVELLVWKNMQQSWRRDFIPADRHITTLKPKKTGLATHSLIAQDKPEPHYLSAYEVDGVLEMS